MITLIDVAIEQALYHTQTPFGIRIFSFITELGSVSFAIAVLMVACLLLWKMGRMEYAAGFAVSVIGVMATSEITKRLVERARPPEELRAIIETGYSFPSNHAAIAAAFYGFIIYLAWKLAPEGWRVPLALLFSTIILLVGFSRLYLGVHYLSDVLGGFILGGLFVLVGWKVVQILQGRRFE